MNKMIEDYSQGKLSIEALIEPKVIAKYALEDIEFHRWLIDTFYDLILKIGKVSTGLRKDSLEVTLRIFREALHIIDEDPGWIYESEELSNQGG